MDIREHQDAYEFFTRLQVGYRGWFSFLMSEACPGERSYVGLLQVAGAKATRRGGVEPRARARMMPR